MENYKLAELNEEQLQLLTEIENKLNATLVAYESSSNRGAMEEIAMENSLDSSSL